MTWAEIEALFGEFGWTVTSDLVVEYQENPWTNRLLEALLATVADRDEIESQIEAYAESREEARIELATVQAELDAADELTVGERRSYRRLQALVDELAGCSTIKVQLGRPEEGNPTHTGLLLDDRLRDELARLATFPLPGKPLLPKFSIGGKPL